MRVLKEAGDRELSCSTLNSIGTFDSTGVHCRSKKNQKVPSTKRDRHGLYRRFGSNAASGEELKKVDEFFFQGSQIKIRCLTSYRD
jgi:hypothetical protein